MKAFLHLKGKIRPRRKLSAVSYQPLALSIWQLIKYCALDKIRYLRTFLQSILVFVSCSAALAQESVVHTTPAVQAEVIANKMADTNITPLKIGDKIPDELWEMYFPVVSAKSDQVQYLSLGDFKDKLIILDFWATWCGSCIKPLFNLDTLQGKFIGDIKVIPASYESENKVKPFLKERSIDLPSLIMARQLGKYFPHRALPHQVWLKNGKVFTITHSEYASVSNIEKILAGQQLDILQKKELVDFDLQLIKGNNDIGKLFYHSTVTSHMPVEIAEINYMNNGISAYNFDLISLFIEAFSIPRFPLNSRIQIEISDPSLSYRVVGPANKGISGIWEIDSALVRWNKENTFCYSLAFQNKMALAMRRQIMQQDLNRFFNNHFGVKAKVEKRKVRCLALLKYGDGESFKTKGGEVNRINNESEYKLINQPIEMFINNLSISQLRLGIPIINATEYDGKIDLEIVGGLKQLDKLNQQLKSFGLTLKEIYEEIPMLIIFQS